VPAEDNKVVEGECGVFVSPNGSDADGEGTKDKPYATLGMALGKAVSDGKPVYACADANKPFDEAVQPTGEVTLYGGLDCTNGWAYDPKKKSAWTAPADTVPLVVLGSGKVAVYDFAITARDAEKQGGSSIAVLAAGEVAELTMERCDVVSGNGQSGAAGTTASGIGPNNEGKAGSDGGKGDDGDPNGSTLCTTMGPVVGGGGGQNLCGLVNVGGGIGGNGTNDTPGDSGQDGKPAPSGPNMPGSGGAGDDGVNGCKFGNGGANGTAGPAGAGASGIGELTEGGYSGVPGEDGKGPGTHGQGGGGGGGAKQCGNSNAGPGGGGGGAGGCGGLPGTGGQAGGASLGVVSVNATVTLTAVSITTGKGADGGKGGNGQQGGSGGSAGQKGGAGACDGGAGGQGGRGGSGGGGLGGHSVGLAFKGTAPTQTGVTVTPGGAGNGGLGGDNNMALDGASGLSCTSLHFDEGAGSCAK
jgi:hypothetical protein